MALVTIKGSLMNAYLDKKTYNNQEKIAVYLDIYQSKSPAKNKMISIKSDDLTILETLNKEYAEGSIIAVDAMVNAYKNEAYYKFVQFSV